MKKFLTLMVSLLLGLSLFGCGEKPDDNTTDGAEDPVGEPEKHYVGLTDQKNGRLVVYDLDVEDWTSEEAVVWEFRNQLTYIASGIKFRNSEFWGGDVVIFCSSNGGMGIIDYATKEVLWSTTRTPANPHSVELLPNGNIVCAASTGNTVRIFGSSQRTTNCSYFDVSFPDAHGVLWDPSLDVLWAYGASKLAAYKVTGTDAEPTLTPVEGMEYLVPDGNGHDMAPVYGDTDRLWLTGGGRTKQFVKSTGEFITDFVGSSSLAKDVKGVGNFRDNRVVYTYPNNSFYVWTGDFVSYFDVNEKGTRVVGAGTRKKTADGYYKVRIWISDYQ